jgi:hypothetical protein
LCAPCELHCFLVVLCILMNFVISLLGVLSPPCCVPLVSFVICEFSLLCVHMAFQHLLFKKKSYPLLVLFVTSLLCTPNVFFQFCLVLFNISILPHFLFVCRSGRFFFSTSFSATNPTLNIYSMFMLCYFFCTCVGEGKETNF